MSALSKLPRMPWGYAKEIVNNLSATTPTVIRSDWMKSIRNQACISGVRLRTKRLFQKDGLRYEVLKLDQAKGSS